MRSGWKSSGHPAKNSQMSRMFVALRAPEAISQRDADAISQSMRLAAACLRSVFALAAAHSTRIYSFCSAWPNCKLEIRTFSWEKWAWRCTWGNNACMQAKKKSFHAVHLLCRFFCEWPLGRISLAAPAPIQWMRARPNLVVIKSVRGFIAAQTLVAIFFSKLRRKWLFCCVQIRHSLPDLKYHVSFFQNLDYNNCFF